MCFRDYSTKTFTSTDHMLKKNKNYFLCLNRKGQNVILKCALWRFEKERQAQESITSAIIKKAR